MLSTGPCPGCGKDIPAGNFCASCGVRLPSGRGGRLRLSNYAAASRERVLSPWLTTSLFPRLARSSRAIFRSALALVVLSSVAFALLGWHVAVTMMCLIGLPVLFAAYLGEINIRHDTPGWRLALVAIFGLTLGVGWELLAGPIVDDAYYAEMGGQMTTGQLLLCGVAIPITFAVALVAPVALARVLDRSGGESLDGFTIGAVGAMLVNVGATATFLAPQMALAPAAGSQPVSSLLSEVLVEGVAWPLGSVAAGGLFGLALWFTPSAKPPHRYRKSTVLLAASLGAVAFSIAMGFVDVAPIPMNMYLALQVPIALVALLAIRIGVTDALLHEATGDETVDGRLRCAECDHVVAQGAFCSDCGVAIRAATRASRAARRVDGEGAGPEGLYGTSPRNARNLKVLGAVAAGIGVPVAAAMVLTTLLKTPTAVYTCPPDCGRPPLGSPVETNPRYSGDEGAFSVAYPAESSAYEVTFDPPGMNGVQAKYVGGDTGLLNLFGEPALDRSPKQVVAEVMTDMFPGATVDYEIPNASVGYEPGYGVIADLFSRGAWIRVIVMAAVKHDYALIATAAGPYHEFSPDYGTGHPSGANLEVAMDMGKYVNSFRWYGDRRTRQR